jgi:hypothetical protein
MRALFNGESGRGREQRGNRVSVVGLTQALIRRPSRGGIDDYGAVFSVPESWLTRRSLPRACTGGDLTFADSDWRRHLELLLDGIR